MKKPKMPKLKEKLTPEEELVARLLVARYKEPQIRNILKLYRGK